MMTMTRMITNKRRRYFQHRDLNDENDELRKLNGRLTNFVNELEQKAEKDELEMRA